MGPGCPRQRAQCQHWTSSPAALLGLTPRPSWQRLSHPPGASLSPRADAGHAQTTLRPWKSHPTNGPQDLQSMSPPEGLVTANVGSGRSSNLGDARSGNMAYSLRCLRSPPLSGALLSNHITERGWPAGVLGRWPQGKNKPVGGNWPSRADRRVLLPGRDPHPRTGQARREAAQDGRRL